MNFKALPRWLPIVCSLSFACTSVVPPDLGDGGRQDAGPDAGPSDGGQDAGSSDGGPDAGPDAGSADAGPLGAPGDYTRTLTNWPQRSYDVHVPPSYDGFTPVPVVFVLHGGGGDRGSARKLACPMGDLSDPGCLDPMADQHGLMLVYPDGTGAPIAPNVRTWNSGGGDGGWQCVSGYACDQDVDETAYFTDLLADLGSAFRVDGDHLFATGISNGGAMSQRLACSFPHIAAIAPVAGENQYSTTRSCTAAIPVLEIHGTGDPCWPYDGGDLSCLDSNPGTKISVAASIDGWIARNGCQATPTDTALPDTADDGTNTVLHTYQCADAPLELYEVFDGGHTWPGGYQYFGVGTVGLTSRDFSANQVILDFFDAHR